MREMVPGEEDPHKERNSGEERGSKGKECWEFGKRLGLRACVGDEEVLRALDKIEGADGELGSLNVRTWERGEERRCRFFLHH